MDIQITKEGGKTLVKLNGRKLDEVPFLWEAT